MKNGEVIAAKMKSLHDSADFDFFRTTTFERISLSY